MAAAVLGYSGGPLGYVETAAGVMRVGGNKKGVFTRDRQPKAAAYALRRR